MLGSGFSAAPIQDIGCGNSISQPSVGDCMLRTSSIATAIYVGTVSIVWAQFAPADLERERERIQAQISDAEKAGASLDGGVIKTLIVTRIEVLRLSLALIDQRRIASATAAKLEAVVPSSKPDLEQAANIEREMRILDGKLAGSQIEAQKTSAGLIRTMLESKIAAEQLSIAMLQSELLKAKYGIAWLPKGKLTGPTPARTTTEASAADLRLRKGEQVPPRHAQLLVPVISNKRFRPSDWRNGIHEDGIYFDVTHSTSALPKPTRALKGAMVFADLFGEEKLRIGWTINAPLTPGKDYQERAVGMKYNQFMDRHTWMRTTELKDMKIWFEVKEAIYSDGSKESFSE